MPVTATPYNTALVALGNGEFNFSADTFMIILVAGGYIPDVDTDTFRADVTSELATGDGYTADGLALTTVTWGWDSGEGAAVLTADPAIWAAATFTGARYAVVARSTGTAATDRLLSYVDFGSDQEPGGADFTVDFSAGGVFQNAPV